MENLQQQVARLEVNDEIPEEQERQMMEDVRRIEEASKKRRELIDQAKDAIEEMERLKVEEAVIGQRMKQILGEIQVNGNDERNWRCACVIGIAGLSLVSFNL